ncbi:ATPase H(+)-transporting accessory protein 2 isoform X2 [Aphidius gifuensis]|uniref:ATPase H(+)-transporting accessory protein 2 isoform X2 n=1 Tax=Aphidius gifuensis TaxID=684658 RepID=UPI001CDC3BA4|nr:ATPase H(+)-transporting accessory protein 2 isoform X2 [Aphidius gifuensis]
MLKFIFLFAFALTSVYADGEFVILHSPTNLQFSGKSELSQSELKDVFISVLGYSSKSYAKPWDGLSVKDFLQPPEAVVSIAIESIEPFSLNQEVRYPLNADEDEETTWQAISTRLHGHDNNNTLVRINANDGLKVLGHSALFGQLTTKKIDLKYLNNNNDIDKKFIEEVQVIRAIAERVDTTVKADDKTDVYWFVVSGLSKIMKEHGKNSLHYNEAIQLLNDALNELSSKFKNAYNNNVFIAAFTNDAQKTSKNTRSRRAVTSSPITKESSTQNSMNLAPFYAEDYPIVFNIFLWFGIILIFSLLAICIAIAEMDPGRDSIIYRMTSNRMKKDN